MKPIYENGKLLVEVGSKVVTRDGREGRVICTDIIHEAFELITLIKEECGNERIYHHDKLGGHLGTCYNNKIWDIFLPPKKRTLRLYKNKTEDYGLIGIYKSETERCGSMDSSLCYQFHSEIEIED